MNELQQQVDCGEYEVDSHAVAEAILRRLMGRPLRPVQRRIAEPD